jgi:LytS/YehU family sensor histidine kinase
MPGDRGFRMFFVTVLIYFILMIFSALYQLLENRREIEARHTQAQLNYLKAQINPHFLFNTLNNIYSAAVLQHPRTADMVLRLSDLLRYVTYDGQAERVSLQKEIAQIRAYIDLYQLKSEHPLSIRFEVEGDMEQVEIEPLLLLPLVENALKHGDIVEEQADGYLHILLRKEAKRLFFQVENSYNPDNDQKDSVGGVGLDSIRQRLELNYPGRYRLEARQERDRFVSVLEIIQE